MSDMIAREGFNTYRRDELPAPSKAYAFLAVAPEGLSIEKITQAKTHLKNNSGLFRYRQCQTIHCSKTIKLKE